MIDPKVEPIGHIPPRGRIDPAHPGRKVRISKEEAAKTVMEGGKEPDLGIYYFDGILGEYILKETMLSIWRTRSSYSQMPTEEAVDGGRIINCCFPNCGCDGARLCMAENGPSSGSMSLNLEKRKR
jgi:hypothetical protein